MSLLEPAEAAVETPSAPPMGLEPASATSRPRSHCGKTFWRRFRRNTLAMMGLGFMVLLTVR